MGRDGSGVRAVSASSIEITFIYQGRRCRERIKLQPTAANLKRAERHRAAILDAIERGVFDYSVTFPKSKLAAEFAPPTTDLTLDRYLDDWMNRIRPSLKSSTAATHARIVARLRAGLGAHRLADLRWKDVRDWIETQGVGDKTAANLLSVLRSALQEAVDDELIDEHPLAGRKLRKTQSAAIKRDEIDPFTAEERAAILAAADGQERNLIQFALWTGLRMSELCALDWGDVDWLNDQIRITKALTQSATAAESPKTAAGRRDVRLLPPALEALKAQRAHTGLQGDRSPRSRG